MFNLPAYVMVGVVFVWAFADSAFPISLAVPGEPVFLYVGVTLAGLTGWDVTGISLVVAAVLGGFSSDQTSFWIGRRYGSHLMRKHLNRKKRRQAAYMRLALQRYGTLFVVASRVLGPVAWVTPVLCGSLKVSYIRFALASMVGCCIGIGQFVFVGYLSCKGFEYFKISEFLSVSAGSFGLWLITAVSLSCIGLCLFWVIRRMKEKQSMKTLEAS